MFKKDYVIGYRKLNVDKASITQLIEIAQETTISCTNSLEKDVLWYLENDMGWIFLNWNIEIFRYPKYLEEVVCTTIPVKFKSVLGQRDFRIEDKNGEVIMNASVKTALLDLKTKKPIEVPKDILASYGDSHPEFITNRFKMPKITDDGFVLNSTTRVKVKRLDTDTNGHTNNDKYVELAENEIPDDIYKRVITNVRVVYKRETFVGDELIIETYLNNIDSVLVVFKNEDTCCEVLFIYR